MDRVHPRVVFPDLVLLFPSRRPLRRGDPRLGRPNGRRHDDSVYPTAVKAMTTDLARAEAGVESYTEGSGRQLVLGSI